MTLIEHETTADGRTTYEPLILRVSAVGNPQYGRNLAFEGIDGFWGLKDGEVLYGKGEIVKVLLATKPKVNDAAKHYRDIDRIRVATEDEKNGYVAPERPPQQAQGFQTPEDTLRGVSDTAVAPDINVYTLGMAFNNLTHMLLSMQRNEDTEDWFQQNWNLWKNWFSEASRGLPLTPVDEEPEEGDSEQDVAEMDEGFQQAVDRDDARDIKTLTGTALTRVATAMGVRNFAAEDVAAEKTRGTDEDSEVMDW